ncbi:hypothetical protein [Labrys miyagiensis]|nr:hypothetical protein [Labrys miyagiensis]
MGTFDRSGEPRSHAVLASAADVLSTLLLSCQGMNAEDPERGFAALELIHGRPRSRHGLSHGEVALMVETLIERYVPEVEAAWIHSRLSASGQLLSLTIELELIGDLDTTIVSADFPA